MENSFVFDIGVINDKGKKKKQLGISDVIYRKEKKNKGKKGGTWLIAFVQLN